MRRISPRTSYTRSPWSVAGAILILITISILWRNVTLGLILLVLEIVCGFLWVKHSNRNKTQLSEIEHLQQLKRDYDK